MQFDKIIMNPPYHGELHLRIVKEAIQHADNTVNLSPTTWLKKCRINTRTGQWRKKLNGHVSEIEEIGHREANNSFNTGNSIESLGIILLGKNKIDLNKYGFKNEAELSLFNKIIPNDEVFSFSQVRNNEYGAQRCRLKNTDNFRRQFDVPVNLWTVKDNCREGIINYKKPAKAVFYFNNETERQNFIDSLSTNFMEWIYKNFNLELDGKNVCSVFGRMKDYSEPWTDDRFYKFFNLTKEEIEEIENAV